MKNADRNKLSPAMRQALIKALAGNEEVQTDSRTGDALERRGLCWFLNPRRLTLAGIETAKWCKDQADNAVRVAAQLAD